MASEKTKTKAAAPNFKKILVIQTAFLGDAILASSLLEKLQLFFPEAQLDILVRKGNEGIFSGHPYLNKVLVWDKKSRKYQNLLQMLLTIRKEQYDLVVNTQRFGATGFLTAFSGAKITSGFDKNPFSRFFTHKTKHEYKLHETERNLKLVEFCTDDTVLKPRLYPTKKNFEKTAGFKGEDYITIAPASVWFTKQYPPEKWVEFLLSVDRKLNVYLVGAGSDSPLAQKIIDLYGEAIKKSAGEPYCHLINLCGKLDILDTAALYRDALMNYMNDSGPMHIASSMNAPTRAVYCSTIKEFGFGPLSDNSKIVETPLDLSCRPCGVHGRKACPLGHFKCALSIDMKWEN